MFQFQAKFIKDYAFDVAPLRHNLKLALQNPLRTQLSLTTPALEAFNSIKSKIADVILNKKRLYFPKWNRPLFMETDASQHAVGGWVASCGQRWCARYAVQMRHAQRLPRGVV